MGSNPLIARQRIEDAKKHADTVHDRLQEEWAENRRSYDKFHNNLALFSGGTVALSVTYLGYLKASPDPVSYQWLLVASWVSLLLCLVSSLFQTVLHAHYLHYARLREYSGKRSSQREIEAEELPALKIANFRSAAEYEVYQEELKKLADSHREDSDWAGRREKFYNFADVWDSRFARFSFVVGLFFLFLFAVRNM